MESTIRILPALIILAACLQRKCADALVTPSLSVHQPFSGVRQTHQFRPIYSTSSDKDEPMKGKKSKPSWISEAMGSDITNDEMEEWLSKMFPLDSGLSGFAVDPDLGFVAILSGNQNDGSGQRFTYSIVSPVDKTKVSSPEALTLIQLAGGMDLGTAVLPPDALEKIIANHIEEEESIAISKENLRSRVSLSQINVYPSDSREQSTPDTERMSPASNAPVASSPERDAAIQETLEKVYTSVRNLPGIQGVSLSEVQTAMQAHVDAKTGALDRAAFSDLLHTLRTRNDQVEPSKVNFEFVVSVLGDESVSQLSIPVSSPILALGLALRYKISIHVTNECLSPEAGANDEDQILKKFPAFRPIRELYEDAKVMDGFIPSMFQRAQIDNKDKM